jgi:hypothetical protein
MGFCAVPVVEDEINTHLPSSKSIFTVPIRNLDETGSLNDAVFGME